MANEESSGFDTAKLIAGGFAVISGAVTIIGGFTGAVPRLIRNDSAAFWWAIALSLIAVGLSLAGSQVGNRRARPIPATPAAGEAAVDVETRLQNDSEALAKWKEKLKIKKGFLGKFKEWFFSINTRGVFVSLGFLVFIASAAVMIMGLQSTLIKIDQPQISTTWKDLTAGVQPMAQVDVSIDGVATDDTLIVTVRPGEKLTSDNVKGVVTNYAIYQAKVGANLDGSAKMNFEVQVPQGYGSLQIVASLNEVRDCAGKIEAAPTSPSSPAASDSAAPAASNSASAASTHTDPAPTPTGTPPDSAAAAATATGSGVVVTDPAAPAPAKVTASTTALQPVQPEEENYSCVVVLAPVDGVVPPPSGALTPMATTTATVTATVPAL